MSVSKTVSYYDHPLQYDACQPSEDILTSVLENEKNCRNKRIHLNDISAEMLNKIQKMEKKKLTGSLGYISIAEFYQDIGRSATEIGRLFAELEGITRERAMKHTELYIVMSKLSGNQFNRLYDSSNRDVNQRMQHGLAQDHVDGINDESNQSLPSYETANASKMNDAAAVAAAKRVRFWANWKKILTARLGSNYKVD